MDEDQSARRVAQKYLKVVDADYYEFESKNNLKFIIIFRLRFLKVPFFSSEIRFSNLPISQKHYSKKLS